MCSGCHRCYTAPCHTVHDTSDQESLHILKINQKVHSSNTDPALRGIPSHNKIPTRHTPLTKQQTPDTTPPKHTYMPQRSLSTFLGPSKPKPKLHRNRCILSTCMGNPQTRRYRSEIKTQDRGHDLRTFWREKKSLTGWNRAKLESEWSGEGDACDEVVREDCDGTWWEWWCREAGERKGNGEEKRRPLRCVCVPLREREVSGAGKEAQGVAGAAGSGGERDGGRGRGQRAGGGVGSSCRVRQVANGRMTRRSRQSACDRKAGPTCTCRTRFCTWRRGGLSPALPMRMLREPSRAFRGGGKASIQHPRFPLRKLSCDGAFPAPCWVAPLLRCEWVSE